MNNTELWCIDCGAGSGYLGKKSETNGNHLDEAGIGRAEIFLSDHETVSYPAARVHRIIFVRTSDIDARSLPVEMSEAARSAIDA